MQRYIAGITEKLLCDQRIRFLIVGGINTAVGYGTFAVLVFCGTHYIAAHVAATVAGTSCSYVLNKYFTFRQYKKSFTEACRFVLVYAVSFFAGVIVLYSMVSKMSLNPYAAGVINLAFTTMISWFGHRYFSFRSQ
ncbi:MAG: GtrA family protein [bacterium]|nr:GtrA family protein [bacterium]